MVTNEVPVQELSLGPGAYFPREGPNAKRQGVRDTPRLTAVSMYYEFGQGTSQFSF